MGRLPFNLRLRDAHLNGIPLQEQARLMIEDGPVADAVHNAQGNQFRGGANAQMPLENVALERPEGFYDVPDRHARAMNALNREGFYDVPDRHTRVMNALNGGENAPRLEVDPGVREAILNGRGARGGTIPGEVPHDIDLDPYFGNVGDRVFDAGRRFADFAEDPNVQAAVQGIANMGGTTAINRLMALAGAAAMRAGGVPPPIANTLATVGTGLGVNPINAIARAGANRLADLAARPPGAPPALPNIEVVRNVGQRAAGAAGRTRAGTRYGAAVEGEQRAAQQIQRAAQQAQRQAGRGRGARGGHRGPGFGG
jgi:hypothetical protein